MGKGSYPQGAPFRARPSDAYITPFAKSGTTWLQQIAHGLRSGGDMDFAEISYVVPCLDYALEGSYEGQEMILVRLI